MSNVNRRRSSRVSEGKWGTGVPDLRGSPKHLPLLFTRGLMEGQARRPRLDAAKLGSTENPKHLSEDPCGLYDLDSFRGSKGELLEGLLLGLSIVFPSYWLFNKHI